MNCLKDQFHLSDGGWSDGGSWSPCSVTCGGGITRRSRRCDSPSPSPFGQTCVGNDEQADVCGNIACQASSEKGTSLKLNDRWWLNDIAKVIVEFIPYLVFLFCPRDNSVHLYECSPF